MNWLLLAIITAFCFGLYNFFIKLASGSIHQMAGAVLLQLVAAAVGGILLLYIKTSTKQVVGITQTGIMYSCLAGLSVGLAEILTFYVFTKGAPASVGTPVIIGGSVVVAALLGWLVLREQLTLAQVMGVGLVVGGVALLARGH